MDSPSVRCREEDEFQERLSALLAELRWGPAGPTDVAKDFLCLPEYLGHVYLVALRAYRSWEIQFEGHVRSR